MKRSYKSELQVASAITGEPVEEIEKRLKNKNRSFSIGKGKFTANLTNPSSNIRGQRASMMIFDCSVGCPNIDRCLKEMECPYDNEN